jgi:hypothetical protein
MLLVCRSGMPVFNAERVVSAALDGTLLGH